jgi:hypothetical protein
VTYGRLLASSVDVCRGLIELGRLQSLLAVEAFDAADKAAKCASAFQNISTGSAALRFLNESYLVPEPSISWSAHSLHKTSELLSLDVHARRIELQHEIVRWESSLAGRAQALLSRLRSDIRLATAAQTLAAPLSRFNTISPCNDVPWTWPDCVAPMKSLTGPLRGILDPRLVRSSIVSNRNPPTYESCVGRAAPYFWILSMHERMASDLCLLNIIEYDGLAPAFYLDFAKQAWDEARHSILFFDLAVHLICDVDTPAEAFGPFAEAVAAYRHSPVALPVPHEGSLYQLAWACSLDQRLVLMHHDTEAPSIGPMKAVMRSAFCDAHIRVREVLEGVVVDETTHAVIGKRWLRAVSPNVAESLVDAKLLRGILILSAFAAETSVPLRDLVDAELAA